MKTYHFSAIKEITDKGLFYFNENEEIKFIEFNRCIQKWQKYVNNSGQFLFRNDNVKNLYIANKTCVGTRNWHELPPFIEFFYEDNIRFTFEIKTGFFKRLNAKADNNNYRFFKAIMMRLEERGYMTYDLG